MASSGWMSKIGVTPGKLVMVGVLAAILVAVLVSQIGTRTESAEEPSREQQAKRETPRSAGAAARMSAIRESEVGDRKDRQWPEILLEEVIAHDPFALPEALAPPPTVDSGTGPRKQRADAQQAQKLREEREKALAAVRERGVQMVLIDQKEQVAIVGDRAVRIGEVLEGFRVVAINSAGVTLSEEAVDPD